ncbi:MAG: aminotransferase class III-fold pyridoxal phosphate-dependent enzyme [Verrucomicrobiota bacterium]
MHKLAQLDHRYLWHPFTQMRDWLKQEPILIVAGQGATLRDVHGIEYLDANSSIWTNLHGHGHPAINRAIERQLRKIAHSSALGFANEPASLLAAELIRLANLPRSRSDGSSAVQPPAARVRQNKWERVFFSDDGSTAMEVALKLAYEYARRSGRSRRPRFISLRGAYHGDTVGAVSLGHIDLFHRAYSGLLPERFYPGPLLLPLSIQPGRAGTARRPDLSAVQLGMRRGSGTEVQGPPPSRRPGGGVGGRATDPRSCRHDRATVGLAEARG